MDELKPLMDLFNAQTGIINTLWNIFVVVSLGVLGFVLKEKDLRENWMIKLAFSFAFIIFAYGNLQAISRSQAILVATSQTLVKSGDDTNRPLVKPGGTNQTDYRPVLKARLRRFPPA